MDDFRAIAQQVADDIVQGRLQPGDRLPPQRVFAYRRGIAPSTASRVYGELTRRGLIAGETGRGTFVRATPPAPRPALAEPPLAAINLETNYPILPDQQKLLTPVLRQIAGSPQALHRSLRETAVSGTVMLRDSVSHSLIRRGWQPAAASLLFAGNGRQALAATFSAVARPGERIGFEALTYPVAKAIAARQGLIAVPLAMDKDGVRPDAIEVALRAAPLRAIYLQPTMHNPLGTTMPPQRRTEIASMLERLNGPVVIEDSVYAFLEEDAPPPLYAFAPDFTLLIDSLSKRIGPGLTLGLLSVPARFVEPLSAALVAGAWGPTGFAMEVCCRWLADGTVATLESGKRLDAVARQQIANQALAGLAIRANPSAYHLFVELPKRLRAATLVEMAAARGIAITPASAFAVLPAHAPNAIRIGLANLDLQAIDPVLSSIAEMVRTMA
jgi:DNA-binding transcriptional MocR family regulator